jgi:CTP synthase (UTP-ammonia lyase)
MAYPVEIVLIGDRDDTVVAHRAIPLALDVNAASLGIEIIYKWLDTASLKEDAKAKLKDANGMWCVPASPYRSIDGALAAIQYARQTDIPFLGTCGGYQHAAIEYCRNVRGHAKAENIEENSTAELPLIGALRCALIEADGAIELTPGSKIAGIYNQQSIRENYHCSYGINPDYIDLLIDNDLTIGSVDADGDPRSIELLSHRFFIGTAFQPERSALEQQTHPLIQAFIKAATA